MIVLILVAIANALSPHHDWYASTDRRNYDGELCLEVCLGRYQMPETFSCIEVVLRKAPRT